MSLQNLQARSPPVFSILAFPPEITTEIFIRCLPCDEEDVFDATRAPLLLTHVCATWRELAIATPLLWTTFNVEFEGLRPHLPEMAKEWLKRSQGCLLSARFCGSGPSDVEYLEGFKGIFGQHSARVRSLDLELGPYTAAALDGLSLHAQLTTLEELRIFFVGNQENLDEAISTFGCAPLLRKVDIFQLSLASIKLPLQQLTEFAVNEITAPNFLDALRQMPQLTRGSFALSDDDEDDGDDEPLQPLGHYSLQHLTITAADPTQYPYWFELLTLPSLQTLIIRDFDDWDGHPFLSFLLRSSPPLRRFSLRGERSLKIPTQPVFENLQQLTELLFASASREGISAFFDAFGADPGLLPRLESLTFICRGSEGDDDVAGIIYVIYKTTVGINKRRGLLPKPERPLRSLRILVNKYDELPFKLPEEFPLPLLRLKESGMDIHVGVDEDE